ncbi:hypothetical protein C6P45_001743 [Maudiozyma exigua]|uniref:WD repeat-containing protein 44 n=1 Tax=Maudiozyma exigua TaxID=34358 RepID=A0A9P6VZS2_MAUEX|nr:hypothetical protein C6P45_001743 [Kazachstania exigua]
MLQDSNNFPVAKVSSIPDILFNGSKIKRNGSKNKKEKDGSNSQKNSSDISRISNEFHVGDSKDDNDESLNSTVDYSADFEPLKFKMNRTPEPPSNTTDTPQEYLDSLEQIRQQIQKVTNSTVTTQRPINANMIPWSFGDIDKEQFEEYLEKPHYIRCLPRKADLKIFNRLFLAQELKDTSNEPELSYDTARTNTSNKTRSRGRGSVSSNASNSDSLKKAIWKTQFSLDGKYMAIGSKDGTVKVLKVISSPVERWEMDNVDESKKISRAKKMLRMKQLAASSTFSKLNSGEVQTDIAELQNNLQEDNESTNLFAPVFHPTPFKIFKEHTFDVLDLDWSKNNFLLTASMDKTVKLWHLDRRESLRTFHHPDFVTGVKFHPTDDRFFVTGCLDHKCRLWSIIDNEVSYEYDCQDLITSIEIFKDDGKYTIIGTFNGFIHILLTKGLKLVLSFHVSDKEIKWTDSDFVEATKHTNGPRITGIQIISGSNEPLILLVTSNDSRIRVFDIEKRKIVKFLKGFQSGSSQHQAFYLEKEGEPTVLCSSDDHWLYGWNLRTGGDENATNKERSHSVSTIETGHDSLQDLSSTSSIGSLDDNDDFRDHDENGKLVVPQSGTGPPTLNKKKGRRRSRIFHSLRNIAHSHHRRCHSIVKNSRYCCFHAHHFPVTTSLVAPVETSKVLSLSNDFICELTLDTIRDNRSSYSNSFFESSAGATSDVVNAIGTILITTDNQGTIRVFRTDISTKIRNKVMNDLKIYENGNSTNTGGTEIHNSINCFAHNRIDSSATIKNDSSNGVSIPPGVPEIKDTTPRSSSELLPTGECDILRTPNGHVINNVRPTGGPHLIYNNSKNNISGSSIGKIIATSSARRHAKSTSSNNSTGNESGSARNIVANLSALSLRCNVCNGTNFTQYSNNMGLQRDNNYSCVDCGTTLNNFR